MSFVPSFPLPALNQALADYNNQQSPLTPPTLTPPPIPLLPFPPTLPQALADHDNRRYPIPSSKEERSGKKDKKRGVQAMEAEGPPLAVYELSELQEAGGMIREEVEFVKQVRGGTGGQGGRRFAHLAFLRKGGKGGDAGKV